MRIQLADNNSNNGIVRITNRNTGQSLMVPLEGRKERKARKKARKQVKAKKREGRQTRRMARAEGKTARVQQRQESKTQRQATKQEKRQRRADVGVEKQEKRMIRVKGKQDIIRARQEQKLEKIRGARSDNFEPTESDSIPDSMYEETPGGDYMVDQVDQMDLPDESAEMYVDTEQYPTEEEIEEYEAEEVFPEEELSDLSLPFLAPLIKGVGKITGSKAGQAVSKYSSDRRELQRLKIENVQLQKDLQSKKTTTLIVGGVTLIAGATLGYLISKRK